MDTKKNIQKNSSLSLLDMRMEQFTVSLSKKCDRLATALYLVTNFLSDNEPLKFRLRFLSLELVRGATLVKYGTMEDESNILGNVSGNISETLGLFELAFINGLISEMNFSILKREYVSLSDAIQIRKTSRTSRADTLFNDSFFGSPIFGDNGSRAIMSVPEKEPLTPSPRMNSLAGNSTYSQGQTKGQIEIKDNQTPKQMSDRNPKGHTSHTQKSGIADFAKSHRAVSTEARSKDPTFMHPAQNSIQIKSRRMRIMKLVKDKKEVSIKDISDHFPELSEKTIQRELVSLTELGVFKRVGLRRWSRYSLA
ncbi:MAG: DeoR family transcriptional regulator [Candidatus Yonathbacteria bacterium]|nr:DeoR family transcriptional regulator [Candidatus Yonathbacteria bacterium]